MPRSAGTLVEVCAGEGVIAWMSIPSGPCLRAAFSIEVNWIRRAPPLLAIDLAVRSLAN